MTQTIEKTNTEATVESFLKGKKNKVAIAMAAILLLDGACKDVDLGKKIVEKGALWNPKVKNPVNSIYPTARKNDAFNMEKCFISLVDGYTPDENVQALIAMLDVKYVVEETETDDVPFNVDVPTVVEEPVVELPTKGKLDAKKVKGIKLLLGNGTSRKEICELYGVGRGTLGDIATGKSWKNV